MVAAHTEGLAELQQFRDAMEPTGAPIAQQLGRLLDAAVTFYVTALPMRALVLADHELARAFREMTARTGLGPQVPLAELAEWVTGERRRGRIRRDVDARAAALMICGAANHLAVLDLLLPDDLPDEITGGREGVVALLLAALTTEPATLAVEP